MSGDRLARIEELRRTGQLGAITVSDVLALVEIARAARALIDLDPEDVWDDTAEFDSLRSALARLDSGAAE